MKNKKIKVMADNINGIFAVKSFEDYDGCEVLSPADFWECLADCSPEMEKNSFLVFQNKTIGAELDGDWFNRINKEYRIQQNFSGWSDYETSESHWPHSLWLLIVL